MAADATRLYAMSALFLVPLLLSGAGVIAPQSSRPQPVTHAPGQPGSRVFTVKVEEQIHELRSGGYVFIPRGTRHGHANVGADRVKVLLTNTPAGFERYLHARAELLKTMKGASPEFQQRMSELRKQYDIEELGVWDIPQPGRDIGKLAAPNRQREAERAAIEKLQQRYITATLSWDPVALTDLWTDDAIRFTPGQPVEVGRQSIRSSNERWAAHKGVKVLSYIPDTKDVTMLDGWAVEWGHFTASYVGSPGGEAKRLRGMVLTVLKNLPDGSWKWFRRMDDTLIAPGGQMREDLLASKGTIRGAAADVAAMRWSLRDPDGQRRDVRRGVRAHPSREASGRYHSGQRSAADVDVCSSAVG